MHLQTLRDWVVRFNEAGPEGLVNRTADGPERRLSPEQLEELADLVETGPDPETDGLARWRIVDIKQVIRERYGVDYHERSVGKLLIPTGVAVDSFLAFGPRRPTGHPARRLSGVCQAAFVRDVSHPGPLGMKHIGFSHISARPQHPGQDPETIAAFKKTSRRS